MPRVVRSQSDTFSTVHLSSPGRARRAWRALGSLICLLALAGAPPRDEALEHEFGALQRGDVRLAGVVYRLTTANASLCARRMPATGLVLHAMSQYAPEVADAARRRFAFVAPVSVEGVVTGAAADLAGVRANDGLLALNGVAVAPPPVRAPTSSDRDEVERRLAALPAAAPITLDLLRGEQHLVRSLSPVAACRTRAEVLSNSSLLGQSDGETIQLGDRVVERYDDEELAVLVAHELAHTILRHRERLEAAGVRKGVLGEFGRSLRLNREAEVEADLFSLRLLRNAGYDPRIAPRFWEGPGSKRFPGLLRSPIYPSGRARAARMRAEIARTAHRSSE